jgi:hypothetical protein
MSDFDPDGFEGTVVKGLSRIETKLDGHQAQLSDHETRIRQNEVDTLVAKTIAVEAERHSKIVAQKKAAAIGLTAGAIPIALKAAWTWLTSPHH